MSRLLIVDDDGYVLRALSRILAANSTHEIEISDDPEKALQRLADSHFDVIISDYGMAKMDGVQFLEQAQKCSPASVRILLSGLADTAVLAQSINRCGIYQYIAKPWDDQQLLGVIDEAVRMSKTEIQKNKAFELVSTDKYGFCLNKLSKSLPINHSVDEVPCHSELSHLEQIQAALTETFQLMGFEFFDYSVHEIDRTNRKIEYQPGHLSFGNYPSNLSQSYSNNKVMQQYDPVMLTVIQQGLYSGKNPVYGTWDESCQSVHNLDRECDSQRLEQIRSYQYEWREMARKAGINFAIFMAVIEPHKVTTLHLAKSGKDRQVDPDLWKAVYAVIQLSNQAMRHVSACKRCNAGTTNTLKQSISLTSKQKEILKTFLVNTDASLKSVSRIHGITADSVNFHLKNIRQVLNKPGAPPHALAAFANSLNLI